MALPVFTAPNLPAEDVANSLPAVVPVDEGALTRIFDLVQDIKAADGYSEAIGMDLGLIGPQDTPPDMATIQPEITATVSGNACEIGWGWGGNGGHLDQPEIQVDRGQGAGWEILTFDTTPGYTDTAPHPASASQWKYRAIYRVDDHQVGQWSATVSVMVGG